jgi:hypothetical protein
MSKLQIVAAVACLALAGGCKGKTTSKETQKVSDDRSGSASGSGSGSESASASGSGSESASGTLASMNPGGMPGPCNNYKAAIDKLASCDKLDASTRDALKQAYTQLSAGWSSLPPEAKPGISATCQTALDALNKSAKSTCGW